MPGGQRFSGKGFVRRYPFSAFIDKSCSLGYYAFRRRAPIQPGRLGRLAWFVCKNKSGVPDRREIGIAPRVVLQGRKSFLSKKDHSPFAQTEEPGGLILAALLQFFIRFLILLFYFHVLPATSYVACRGAFSTYYIPHTTYFFTRAPTHTLFLQVVLLIQNFLSL